MNTAYALTDYVLGSDNAEHERLMRQARTLAPYTERLLLDAGVAKGQRVLDVGSGVGDVAMLAASLVGSAGSVLGIDRDPAALNKARARAAAARTTNVQFVENDLLQLRIDGEFDAIVGRFILMFLPDPTDTLRTLTAHLRPGGVIAFHEASWASFFALAEHLPLRTACGDLICRSFHHAGARSDMAHTLYRGLLECGYPAPNLRVEVPMANDADSHSWLPELIATLLPRFKDLGIATHAVGEFSTLPARLEFERENARSYAPLAGLVGAWGRKVT